MIQTKGYYNDAINVRWSLDGYGSKIRKVSRCRPKVLNETILATKQEFFLYKISFRTKHNWHCFIGFLIITAPLNVYFILHYHLFFRNFFFLEGLYYSKYDIWIFLFVFWLRYRPSIKYVHNWGNGGRSSKMCTGAF